MAGREPSRRDRTLADIYAASTAPSPLFDFEATLGPATKRSIENLGAAFGMNPSPFLYARPTVEEGARQAREMRRP